MALHWNDSLAVGVADIDTQHKELFDKINALLDAFKNRAGGGDITGTVKFLEAYVVKHFGNEQKLMTGSAYPKMDEHLGYHKEFMREFGELKEALAKEPNSIPTQLKLQKVLVDWWMNHINRVDKELGAFLVKKAA